MENRTKPLEEYRKEPHWSYSSLNQLLNICSLQWAFQRIYRLEAAFTPVVLSFGSAYHRTMEWIGMKRMQQDWPDPNEACDVFADLWERQTHEDKNIRYAEDQDHNALSKQGRGLIECFVSHLDPNEEVLAVNYTFRAPLRTRDGLQLRWPLIGEIDAIYRKGTQEQLIDWKTSAKRWSSGQADRSLQPTAMLYGYLYDTGRFPSFRFDVMVKNKTPVFEQHVTTRTEEHVERMARLAEKAERIIEHEIYYPAEQNNYCSSCAFHEPCRAWHRKQACMISLAA